MKSDLDWLINQLMGQLLAIYYLTEEFLICLPQKQEENISCCNFFAFMSVLGDFCKHWDTTTITQLSGGQATTGSSLALGISHDSIMYCQDWGRLLCKSNVVDPHHEHPPAYTESFLPVEYVCTLCKQGFGFLNSIPQQPALYGITLSSYSIVLPSLDALLPHTKWPLPTHTSHTFPTHYTQIGNVSVVQFVIFFSYISTSVQMPPPSLCCHFGCCWKAQICGMFCLFCWFPSCTY